MARIKKEIEEQLAMLLHKRFFSQTPWERLQHLPRYIKAMKLRLDKYPSSIDRDTKSAQNVQMIWQRWQDKVSNLRKANAEISEGVGDYRWLIEELRVSLFAQELKTPFPVSVKRLDKIWDDLRD
jgi:ATP-dependent helicase HrpA